MASTDQVAAFLAKNGIRETPQRVFVVEELAREENDATAAQIYDRLRRRGTNTVPWTRSRITPASSATGFAPRFIIITSSAPAATAWSSFAIATSTRG
jgi:hypothetical protein